jgi:hypothetical protein
MFHVEISKTSATLESLDCNFDLSNVWESIRENIKTLAKGNHGYHSLDHNELWFGDECSKLIDKWNYAHLKW